jgi:hypothetical protein
MKYLPDPVLPLRGGPSEPKRLKPVKHVPTYRSAEALRHPKPAAGTVRIPIREKSRGRSSKDWNVLTGRTGRWRRPAHDQRLTTND